MAPQVAIALVHGRRCARLTSRVDVVPPVDEGPGAGEEHVARFDFPAVTAQGAHRATRTVVRPVRIRQQVSEEAHSVHWSSDGTAESCRGGAASSPPMCTRRVTTELSSGATARTRNAPCAIREKIGAATRPP